MASRFYLPSSGAAAVSVTDFTGWDVSADRLSSLQCDVNKISSASTPEAFVAITNLTSSLYRQWVSVPIAAQTISGTVKGQTLWEQFNATKGAIDLIYLRLIVVSNDGATVRGTLLSAGSHFANAAPIDSAMQNGTIADGDSLTSVAASENDRIVIQVGAHAAEGVLESKQKVAFTDGDDSGTDLPEDETDTNSYNAWIEFSGTITFPSVARRRFVS